MGGAREKAKRLECHIVGVSPSPPQGVLNECETAKTGFKLQRIDKTLKITMQTIHAFLFILSIFYLLVCRKPFKVKIPNDFTSSLAYRTISYSLLTSHTVSDIPFCWAGHLKLAYKVTLINFAVRGAPTSERLFGFRKFPIQTTVFIISR